jgi:hypothetical protein
MIDGGIERFDGRMDGDLDADKDGDAQGNPYHREGCPHLIEAKMGDGNLS